jgi:hypothetical protein
MPDDTFKEFVLDQLGALPELRAGDVRRLREGNERNKLIP